MPRIFDNIEQALLPALAENSTIRPRRTSRNDWVEEFYEELPLGSPARRTRQACVRRRRRSRRGKSS